jgi:hypothetical protein
VASHRVSSIVRRTMELSCEAPIVSAFVSFKSLLGGSGEHRDYQAEIIGRVYGDCGN